MEDIQVSKHFKLSEMQCKCNCGSYIRNEELLELLEEVREHFGPVTVTSATRCERHNKAVGGVEGSRHTKGQAADIQVPGVAPRDVYEFLDAKHPITLGLGNYSNFTHMDSRHSKGRWNG